MDINTNNQKDMKKNSMLILGLILLVTPFSIVGVFILIGYFINNATKSNDRIPGNSDKRNNNNKQNNNNKPNYIQQSSFNPSEFNPSENRKDIKNLNSSTNNYYEQEASPLIVDSVSTKCDVCRATNDKGTKYCKYCGELLGKGKKCGFCGTKNELSAHHCKNCGVIFK